MSRKRLSKTNIFEFYSDFSKEQILNAIARLKREDRILLQKAYTESYDNPSFYQNLSKTEQTRVKTILHSTLKNRIENPSFDIERIETIFEKYFNYTKEQIWQAFHSLSKSQQNFLIEIYGMELDNLEQIETLTPSQKVKLKRTINESLLIRLKPTKIILVKNIFERYPDYSHEEILEAISRLSESDQQLLYLSYGPDLTDKSMYSNLSAKEKERIKNIVSFSIKKRLDNKHLVSSLQKKSSIFDYYENYSKTQILNAISRLSKKDQELLQIAYGISYDETYHFQQLSSEEKEKINDILRRKLKLRLEKPQTKQSKAKTVFDYFKDYTKEEIITAIHKLPPQDQERLIFGFGENYNDLANYSFLSTYEKSRLTKIITRKIKSYLENPEKTIKQCNNIQRYYQDYSKDEILEAVTRLSETQRQLITTIYGEDLEITDHYSQLSHSEKEKIRYILSRTLLERLQNPEKVESIKGKIIQTIPERYPEKSYLELEFAISKLTMKRQEILKKAFGEKFDNRDNYETLNKEEKRSVQIATTQLKEKIKKIEENGFFGYFNKASQEEIMIVVKNLSEEHQLFLHSLFGDRLNEYHNLKNLSDSELNQLREIVQTIKTLVKRNKKKTVTTQQQRKQKIKNSPVIRERKKKQAKSLKQYFSFISIERLEELISYLPIEDQHLLIKAYGNSYDSIEGIQQMTDKDSSRVYYIRMKLKKVIQGEKVEKTLNPNRRMGQDAKSIIEYFKEYSKEEVINNIKKLSLPEQQLLQKAYGVNFEDATLYYQLDEIEKRQVQKLKIKVKNALSGKTTQDKNIRKGKAKTVIEYFHDTPKEELERAISLLTPEQIELLKKAYGENYNTIDGYFSLSDVEKRKVYYLKCRMKQYLSGKEIKNKTTKRVQKTPKKKPEQPTPKHWKKEEKITSQSKDNIGKESLVIPERKQAPRSKKNYIPLSRQKELKWIKASKLSYYDDVDSATKKEYLQYYFEVYPLRRKKYEEVLLKMIDIKNKIEKEYIYYAHQENGLNQDHELSIQILSDLSIQLQQLEIQRKNLLEKYIVDSKEKRDSFLANNQRLVSSIAKKNLLSHHLRT